MNNHRLREEQPTTTGHESIEVPALRVVGISIRTTNRAEAEAETGQGPIAQLWQRFTSLSLGNRIPNPYVSGEIVAVYHNYESDEKGEFTLTIGPRVTSLHRVPDDLDGIEVPFQTYARFTVEGPPDRAIADAWQKVWGMGLDRAYTFDLEIYQPGGTPEQTNAEILVALRA